MATMTVDDWIPVMVERIVERFHPVRVILFGSRARGDNRVDSDVDLLVVIEDGQNDEAAELAILRSLSDLPVAKDVVVTTPDDISQHGSLVSSVLRPALHEGRVLYDRQSRN